MLYGEFEIFALSHASLLILLWTIFPALLIYLTHRITGNFLSDPFHFWYTFTYGTSYGVLALMAFYGYLDWMSAYISFGFGLLFIISFKFFSNIYITNFKSLINAIAIPKPAESKVLKFILFLYIVVSVLFIAFSGFGAFSESRFESAKGFGLLVRLLEPLRLLIVGWFGLNLIKYWKFNVSNIIKLIFLSAFSVYAGLINGAKFAMLEGVYVISIALIVSGIKLKISKTNKFFATGFLLFFIITFVLYVMANNIVSTGGDPFSQSQLIEGLPVLIERLLGRILWNADMYFLSFPNEIYKEINVDNAAIRFCTSIFGSQLVSYFVGYDASQYDVGRQIWLYWDPNDSVMRGPTNHFDLTAYYYFGMFFGIFFLIILSAFLSQINRVIRATKTKVESPYTAVFISIFWIKALTMLMNPAAGLAWCIDLVVILFFVKMLFTVAILISRKSRLL